MITSFPGVTCVKPKAALYLFPRLDPGCTRSQTTRRSCCELLESKSACSSCRGAASTGRGPTTCASCSCRTATTRGSDAAASAISSTAIDYAPSPKYSEAYRHMKPLQVGLLGFGTVGARHLGRPAPQRGGDRAARRARHRVTWIATRTLDRARDGTRGVAGVESHQRSRGRRRHPDVDIVCELIGGIEPARDARARRDRATASTWSPPTRRCSRMHGNEIFARRAGKGVMVAFEAAVAGGVPIIKALREGLTANRIEWIAGIINGTRNFILSEMRDNGRDRSTKCSRKRRRAAMPRPIRPSTSRASTPRTSSRSCRRSPSACRCSSTRRTPKASRKLTREDIRYAEELGYRIKLLGITRARRTARASSCACIRR